MNIELAYLLGMIYGNGEIRRNANFTTISIDIPHKKLETEDFHDIKLYVKASITDIKQNLEPLIGSNIDHIQDKSRTTLSFTKPSSDYLIRDIIRLTDGKTDHSGMRVHKEIFSKSNNEKIYFLKGFSDVTGYIRRSNYFFTEYKHRVYIETNNNWQLVADICNLLKDVGVPVQTIDWAHPNMRDSNLKKYNEGKRDFWKKEHQIKIFVNEFKPIGFGVIHKQQALENFIAELEQGYLTAGKKSSDETHKFYWEKKLKTKEKPSHPSENDDYLPENIRGIHFDNWTKIAEVMGYNENS